MNKAVMVNVGIGAILMGWCVLHAVQPDEKETKVEDKPLRSWLQEEFKVRAIGKSWSEAVQRRFGADPKKAILDLSAFLEDRDEMVRWGAVESLSYFDKTDLKAVQRLILKAVREDKSSWVRESAVRALPRASLEDKTVLAALLRALKEDKVVDVRTEIVCKFRDISGQEAKTTVLPAVIDALQDRKGPVRRQAVYAVAEFGEPTTMIPLLIRAFKDKDDSVRMAAVTALGDLCPKAIPLLRESLKDKDPVVRAGAVEALGKAKEDVRPLILKELPAITPLLKDKDRDVVRNAPRTLGAIQAVAAVPLLVAKLDDADAGVRSACICALSEFGSDAAVAVEKLIKGLKDPDPWLRCATADTLGSIGPEAKAAVPALIELLKDEQRIDVRWQAAMALGDIGPGAKAAVPKLKEVLKTADGQLKRYVEEALKKIEAE